MTIALARTSPRNEASRRPVRPAAPAAFVSGASKVLAVPSTARPKLKPKVPACDALAALQELPERSSPNFFTSLILAVVSFGLLPALIWPWRFRRGVEADRRALLELAKWGRSRTIDADGRLLMETASRARFWPSLMTVGMAGVLAALAAVAWGITQVTPGHDLFAWLLGMTYGAAWPRFSAMNAGAPLGAFALWTIGLTVAYSAHLVQVHLYAHSVRRFLDEFNKLSIAEGYTPVLLDPISFGCSPWILSAAALLMLSGGWAIPFALAGATDCRLRGRALPRMRKGIVGRMRDILFARVPANPVPPTPSKARCTTSGCGGSIGKGVKFCPRCGAKAHRSVDRWV